jgi:two-component system chemotaxis response regulator CheY
MLPPPPPAPTVLVADDEADLRRLARLVLELDGFEVVGEAEDGARAVELFVELSSARTPTVVLLDNRMPTLTGLEAAERILAIDPGQLVVLFSAHFDTAELARAEELGVAACVDKPDASGLGTVLRGLLAG